MRLLRRDPRPGARPRGAHGPGRGGQRWPSRPAARTGGRSAARGGWNRRLPEVLIPRTPGARPGVDPGGRGPTRPRREPAPDRRPAGLRIRSCGAGSGGGHDRRSRRSSRPKAPAHRGARAGSRRGHPIRSSDSAADRALPPPTRASVRAQASIGSWWAPGDLEMDRRKVYVHDRRASRATHSARSGAYSRPSSRSRFRKVGYEIPRRRRRREEALRFAPGSDRARSPQGLRRG